MKKLARMLFDETATTSVEYLIVTMLIVVGVIGASRLLIAALAQYLHRIYLIVTLPIP